LVRDLPKTRGVTVFVSSHLLTEMEQVATHFAIVAKGQLQFEGTRKDASGRSKTLLEIEVDRPETARPLLAKAGLEVAGEGRRLLVAQSEEWGAARINAMLVEAGVGVSSLVLQRTSLEDLFLELTQEVA
jgi:ABC-2 type transport system ATP-binding protein